MFESVLWDLVGEFVTKGELLMNVWCYLAESFTTYYFIIAKYIYFFVG